MIIPFLAMLISSIGVSRSEYVTKYYKCIHITIVCFRPFVDFNTNIYLFIYLFGIHVRIISLVYVQVIRLYQLALLIRFVQL